MKRFILPLLLLFGLTLLIAGCDKSTEVRKMEEDLFASVKILHDNGMTMMTRAKEMTGKLDETIATHEKMMLDHPKETSGTSTDDLKAAKEKLSDAMTSMKDWMADFKPYDPKMKHEDFMTQTMKAKDGIIKVKAEIESGLAAASAAIDSHKAWADDMMAKLSSAKKPGKKK